MNRACTRDAPATGLWITRGTPMVIHAVSVSLLTPDSPEPHAVIVSPARSNCRAPVPYLIELINKSTPSYSLPVARLRPVVGPPDLWITAVSTSHGRQCHRCSAGVLLLARAMEGACFHCEYPERKSKQSHDQSVQRHYSLTETGIPQ